MAPAAASYTPGRRTAPEMVSSRVPGSSRCPARGTSRRRTGRSGRACASVSTFCTSVGPAIDPAPVDGHRRVHGAAPAIPWTAATTAVSWPAMKVSARRTSGDRERLAPLSARVRPQPSRGRRRVRRRRPVGAPVARAARDSPSSTRCGAGRQQRPVLAAGRLALGAVGDDHRAPAPAATAASLRAAGKRPRRGRSARRPAPAASSSAGLRPGSGPSRASARRTRSAADGEQPGHGRRGPRSSQTPASSVGVRTRGDRCCLGREPVADQPPTDGGADPAASTPPTNASSHAGARRSRCRRRAATPTARRGRRPSAPAARSRRPRRCRSRLDATSSTTRSSATVPSPCHIGRYAPRNGSTVSTRSELGIRVEAAG